MMGCGNFVSRATGPDNLLDLQRKNCNNTILANVCTMGTKMEKNINRATGFGIIEGKEIDVRTVSPTDIGAMVNFLLISRGIEINNTTPDHEVENLWEIHKGTSRLRPVHISVAPK